ncbi:uncharacterized protein LOC133032261 [Cannabis sativa]|uniref:uncharacterized protein LOC133032261 n=1 Tax=Cannabis sativa TaxID=3483 RepID=UPI0029C9CBED|nr:uncharacterized protein LOC133032261 [Cannabis sativa]
MNLIFEPPSNSELPSSLTCWDVEILDDLLVQRDRQLVQLIPIQPRSDRDTLYWSKDLSGLYTVKSAYNLLQELNGEVVIDDSVVDRFWGRLWQLKIPLKMKNLLWRAAKCCLPTMYQLQLKRVEVDILCPVCLLEAETISHALLTCPAAILCWNRVGIGTIMQQDMSFLDWCIRQFLVLDVERTSLLVAQCWAIWNARNDKVWQNKSVGADSNDLLFIGYIPGDGAEQWVAPSANSIKINVNATVFNETHNYGVSVVARHSNRLLVEGCTKLFQGSVDSMVAEAIGFGKP